MPSLRAPGTPEVRIRPQESARVRQALGLNLSIRVGGRPLTYQGPSSLDGMRPKWLGSDYIVKMDVPSLYNLNAISQCITEYALYQYGLDAEDRDAFCATVAYGQEAVPGHGTVSWCLQERFPRHCYELDNRDKVYYPEVIDRVSRIWSKYSLGDEGWRQWKCHLPTGKLYIHDYGIIYADARQRLATKISSMDLDVAAAINHQMVPSWVGLNQSSQTSERTTP